MPIEKLPEWSKTIDPQYKPNWSSLNFAALAFLRMSTEEQKDAVLEYERKYCFPKLDLGRASGLYLLFRIVFDLPPGGMDRAKASAFGGWLHPSIGESGPYRIAWPVEAAMEQGRLVVSIDRFTGYSGKGYDATGEYTFLRANFKAREQVKIEGMIVR
jgi:hypothetical protein